MPIGAGQLLLVGGFDLSADATSVDLPRRTDIREVTGVRHKKRQRKAVGLDDGEFSLTAYFDDSNDTVFGSGQPRITRVFGDAADAQCYTYAHAITDTNLSVTHPVGEFFLSTYAGNINGGIGRGRMLARLDGSYSPGTSNLYTAQSADLGPLASRTVYAVVHIYDVEATGIATATLSLHGSANRRAWTSLGNALNVAVVSGAGADWIAIPDGYTFAGSPMRVYRGAYATTAAATTGLGTPHAVDVVYLTGSGAFRHWNGAWQPYTPPGLLAGSPFANEAAADVAVSVDGQVAVWGNLPYHSTHVGSFSRAPGDYQSRTTTRSINRYVGVRLNVANSRGASNDLALKADVFLITV